MLVVKGTADVTVGVQTHLLSSRNDHPFQIERCYSLVMFY